VLDDGASKGWYQPTIGANRPADVWKNHSKPAEFVKGAMPFKAGDGLRRSLRAMG
jgi:hypothetical protein